jgi:hypothetical protein
MTTQTASTATTSNVEIARAAYDANVTKDRAALEALLRNTEILTIRDKQIVDVEVYFGWALPHKAPQGGFVDQAEPESQP